MASERIASSILTDIGKDSSTFGPSPPEDPNELTYSDSHTFPANSLEDASNYDSDSCVNSPRHSESEDSEASFSSTEDNVVPEISFLSDQEGTADGILAMQTILDADMVSNTSPDNSERNAASSMNHLAYGSPETVLDADIVTPPSVPTPSPSIYPTPPVVPAPSPPVTHTPPAEPTPSPPVTPTPSIYPTPPTVPSPPIVPTPTPSPPFTPAPPAEPIPSPPVTPTLHSEPIPSPPVTPMDTNTLPDNSERNVASSRNYLAYGLDVAEGSFSSVERLSGLDILRMTYPDSESDSENGDNEGAANGDNEGAANGGAANGLEMLQMIYGDPRTATDFHDILYQAFLDILDTG